MDLITIADGECSRCIAMCRGHGSIHRFGTHAVITTTSDFGRASQSCTSAHTIFMQHCIDTLSFQTAVGLFQVMGSDLYKAIKVMMTNTERGLVAGGMRIAFREPCFRFVDHSVYSSSYDPRAPGSPMELAARTRGPEANGTDPRIVTIDIEVARVDFDGCSELGDCSVVEWRRLEMGTLYTLAMSRYLASTMSGLIGLEGALPNEAESLCGYIRLHAPLDVPSRSTFRRHGEIQYTTPQKGWADGARVVSVATSKSELDGAPTCPGGMFQPSGHPLYRHCRPKHLQLVPCGSLQFSASGRTDHSQYRRARTSCMARSSAARRSSAI